MCRVVTDVTNDHIDKVCVISLSAEITVGYTVTDITVSESDGKAQLTVVVTMPTGADPIETSFSLIVNTLDGTATGLPWSLIMYPYTQVTNHTLASVKLHNVMNVLITCQPSVAPGDYGALNNFHLIPLSNDDVRQLSFNVSIVNDSIPEDDEMFRARLTLDPAAQARLGDRVIVSPHVATITIQDDDGNPLIIDTITHVK